MWTCYLFTVFLFLSKSIKQPSGLVRRPLLHARHNYDILTPKKLTQKRRCLFSVGKQFAKFYILYKLMRTVCMYVKCLVHLVFASQTVYFYSWTARAVCNSTHHHLQVLRTKKSGSHREMVWEMTKL